MSLSLERFVVRYAKEGLYNKEQLELLTEVLRGVNAEQKGSLRVNGVEIPTF